MELKQYTTEELSDFLQDAVSIASAAHWDQKDKIGFPYILHPLAVMISMDTLQEKIVAVLHDVVEDTDYTLETFISSEYPEYIVNAIDAITKRKGESYPDYLQRVKNNSLALAVKWKDIEHNTSEERLNQLPIKTQDYLRNKYEWAKEFLKS